MTGSIRKGILLMMVLSFTLLSGEGFSAEWLGVLEEIKVRYKEYEEKIKDVVLLQETKTVMGDKIMTSEIKFMQKGGKFRIENKMQMPDMPEEMPEVKTVAIYDGKDSWLIAPFIGKKKMPTEEIKKQQTGNDWWKYTLEKATIVGTDMVGKRECYVLDIKNREKFSFSKLWIDKKSFVLTKGEMEGEQGKTGLWVYSDFRKIKGDLEMPYKTEVYMNGELLFNIIVKSIEINKGLPDSLFDPNA